MFIHVCSTCGTQMRLPTSWTISFMSLFAALKSSGWVLFNKRDSVYKNRIGHKWGGGRGVGRGREFCKLVMVFTVGFTSKDLMCAR